MKSYCPDAHTGSIALPGPLKSSVNVVAFRRRTETVMRAALRRSGRSWSVVVTQPAMSGLLSRSVRGYSAVSGSAVELESALIYIRHNGDAGTPGGVTSR